MKKYLFLAVVIVLFTGVSGYSQDNPTDRVKEEETNVVNSEPQLSDDGTEGVKVESTVTEEELAKDKLEPPQREKTVPIIEDTDKPAETNPDTQESTRQIKSKMDKEE